MTNELDQRQNKWEKTNILDRAVYSGLNLDQSLVAMQFYERIKDKPLEVLNKYHKIICPQGFFDSISYIFDKKRRARRRGLYRARIEKESEREKIETQEILDYMEENGLSGDVTVGSRITRF